MVAEYIDEDEGFRKEKERQIVEEGRLVSAEIVTWNHYPEIIVRSLWNLKKQEERDLLFRDVDELKQLQRLKMFGRWHDDIAQCPQWHPLCRPGHGAPTTDIRKKKFTEHQLGRSLRRSQSVFSLEDKQEQFTRRPYTDDMNIDPRVSEA